MHGKLHWLRFYSSLGPRQPSSAIIPRIPLAAKIGGIKLQEKTNIAGVKVPLTAYDIFGYLIPGITFLICVLSFEFWAIHKLGDSFHAPCFTLLKITYFDTLERNWALSILYVAILLNFTYVIGHIISSASALFIDRMLIFKGYGYPYEFLLNIPSKTPPYSRSFYRGLFFWLNAYLLCSYYICITNCTLDYLIKITRGILWFLTLVSIVKIAVSSIIVNPKSPLFKVFKCFSKSKFGPFVVRPTKFFITKIFPVFYDLTASMLSRYINTRRSFNEEFITRYKYHFKSNFSLEPENSESNNYWLSYCFVADKSPVLSRLIVNWLHLYSYARNLSMALYVAFIYCFISLLIQKSHFEITTLYALKWLPLGLFLLFIVMLIRYYYLYVCYYSKFVFRSFVYLNEMNTQDTKPK